MLSINSKTVLIFRLNSNVNIKLLNTLIMNKLFKFAKTGK